MRTINSADVKRETPSIEALISIIEKNINEVQKKRLGTFSADSNNQFPPKDSRYKHELLSYETLKEEIGDRKFTSSAEIYDFLNGIFARPIPLELTDFKIQLANGVRVINDRRYFFENIPQKEEVIQDFIKMCEILDKASRLDDELSRITFNSGTSIDTIKHHKTQVALIPAELIRAMSEFNTKYNFNTDHINYGNQYINDVADYASGQHKLYLKLGYKSWYVSCSSRTIESFGSDFLQKVRVFEQMKLDSPQGEWTSEDFSRDMIERLAEMAAREIQINLRSDVKQITGVATREVENLIPDINSEKRQPLRDRIQQILKDRGILVVITRRISSPSQLRQYE